MAFAFTDADFAVLADVLGTTAQREGRTVRFELLHDESGRRLALEITPEALPDDGDTPRGAVAVYGSDTFVQLQGITGYVPSEGLGEVVFFARRGGHTSGLVVERRAGCSLYAHVPEALLSADFTQLPPEVMMSAVALSMTELFEEGLGEGG